MTRQQAIPHSPSKFSLYHQKISAQIMAQIIAQRGFTNTVAVPSTSTTLDPRELLETTTTALGAMAITSIARNSVANNISPNKPRQHIPTEIIVAFGAILDGPSLCLCLRVCRRWYNALQPLTWVTITRRQWYLDSFPLKPWTTLAAPFYMGEEAKANRVFSNIRHTRSVEWYDVSAVRYRGWKGPRYAPSYQCEISLSKLSLILRSMPHLDRLSLVITSDRLHHESVLDVLRVSNLPHLRYLRLHLSFNYSALAVEELFPLFSRLEELNIRGNWYRELDPEGRRFCTYAPWCLKRFTIDHVQIHYFLRHCRSTLEEMTFKRPMVKWSRRGSGYRERMLLELLGMPKLKVIIVSGIKGSDPVEYRTDDAMSLEAVWKRTTVTASDDGERVETVGKEDVTIRDIAAHVLSNV